MKLEIYTIGHSNLTFEAFHALLARHAITAVADVRSSPYSRMYPQFNCESLRTALQNAGVQYIFMGDQLGGRPDAAECYQDGQVRYERVAALPAFQEGLRRLAEGAQKYKIALMCSEKDPLNCHRMLLIGRNAQALGLAVSHILGSGEIETHAAAEQRLFELTKMPQQDLFDSYETLLDRAYAARSGRMAYTQDEAGDAGESADSSARPQAGFAR